MLRAAMKLKLKLKMKMKLAMMNFLTPRSGVYE